MANSRLRTIADVVVPLRAFLPRSESGLQAHPVEFFSGVQRGRHASHGEAGALATEAIEEGLRARGLLSERLGLAEFGREQARTTQAIAQRFGDETWLGRDGDAR